MKFKQKPPFSSNRLEICFQLYDKTSILITGTYAAFTDKVKQLIKQQLGQYTQTEKGWIIPLNQYQSTIDKLRELNEDFMLKPLPFFLQKIEQPLDNLKFNEDGVNYNFSFGQTKELDPLLNELLYPYQREGVQRGLQLKGRILIADEMGVGKTVQSLALASIFRSDWPLLIITPPAMRLVWQDEIVHWLKISNLDIQVISKASQGVRINALVTIISYDLCNKLQSALLNKKYKIAIADECHYLKSSQAQRSQICVPLLKKCQYVLLLTGTPALSKPKDLYNSLNIIRPDIFSNFKDFGYRYCDPKLSRFTNGIDYDGASNLKELHYILTNYIMVRRLKRDVLSQLPEKRRIRVRIQGDCSVTKQITALMDKISNQDINQIMQQSNLKPTDVNDIYSAQQILNKCYVLSGTAKIKGIKEYLSEFLKNQIKFLFFAHHMDVLDGVQELCEQHNIQFIRIDGSINSEQKHLNVRLFQESDDVRVAVLGLTAANFGITLTAASTIVFGEMHWTPAIMLQAEDRAHRIGQENSVDCHYLIGEGTIDESIYRVIENKFQSISTFIDGTQTRLDANLKQSDIQELVTKQTQIRSKQLEIEQPIKQQYVNNNEVDIDEIIDLLESKEKFRSSEIKYKQIEQSQQQKNKHQSLIDSFCKKQSEFKKVIVEDENQYKLIQNIEVKQNQQKQQKMEEQYQLQQQQQQQQQQKIGFEILLDRLSESKQTESENKKRFVNFKDLEQRVEEKIRSTKKENNNIE